MPSNWPLKFILSIVCVFVNPTCNCGNYLQTQKISQLPTQFGPGLIARVLKDVIQNFINCAIHEKLVFDRIETDGRGKVVVTGLNRLKYIYIYDKIVECLDRLSWQAEGRRSTCV